MLRAITTTLLTLSFVGAAHGDETETAGTVGHAIHHEVRFGHGAERRKRVVQVVFSGVEGKISYEQFVFHVMLTVLDGFDFNQTVSGIRISNHH